MLYVITGGPYSGKTTTIEALSAIGYRVGSEAAIEIIRKRQEANEIIEPSRDRHAFQMAVMSKQIEQYARLNRRAAFFDRGIADGIGYFLADGLPAPAALVEAARDYKYDKVFLLEPFSWSGENDLREENPESQRKIHAGIEQAYREQGYRLIPIPRLCVRHRRNLILSYV